MKKVKKREESTHYILDNSRRSRKKRDHQHQTINLPKKHHTQPKPHRKSHTEQTSGWNKSDNEKTATFSVEKMTCATCPIAVSKAMKRVDGVKEVSVDLERNTAVVTYDASVATTSDIGNASTEVGFPASVLVDQ